MRIALFALPLLLFATSSMACGDDDDDDGASDGSGAYSFEAYPLAAPADAVTTESGLQYIDVVVGEGAAPTLAGTTVVTVHYRGLHADGQEFDSSVGGSPVQFQLGGVIPGFGEGVATMRVGGQRVLYIPGELGYGPAGNAKAGIEPNEPLIFEVELIATQ